MRNQLLLERIEERLAAVGLSERKACLNAGLKVDAIRSMRRGFAPKLGTLQRLAKVLQCPVAYLAEAIEDEPDSPRLPLRSTIPLTTIFVRGYVQAGVWREAAEWPANDWYALSVPEDDRFPGIKLYGLEVRGDSMNRIYPNGTILVVARFADIGRLPNDGERVVCLLRSVTGEYEATVKEYSRDERGRHILWPRSYDPEFQTPVVLAGPSLRVGEDLQLPIIARAGHIPSAGEPDLTIQALVVQSVRRE